MDTSQGWVLWVILAAAMIVGYFVVSKVIDFYTKNSSYEPESHTTDSPDDSQDSELIGGHDPNKPIG